MKLLRNLTNQAKKVSGKVPLRILLVVPFVVQVFGVVALTGWLSLRNGQKAVNDVATALRNESAARIQQHLDTYLEKPHLIDRINADAISLGLLNLKDKTSLQRYLWKQSQAFTSVSAVALGTETGEYMAFDRQDDDSIQIRISDNSTGRNLYKYGTNTQGDRAKLLSITPNYDPRTRPWYKVASQAGKPRWSEIYSSFATNRLALTHSQPLYDNRGKLIGVAATDLMLGQIDEFLRSFKIGRNGQTFIIERSGFLLGTSTNERSFRFNKSGKQERIKATESSDLLTRVAANYLLRQFGNLNNISTSKLLDFNINGNREFLQVVPYKDEAGLDWLVVVVVPEADFMEQIDANTRSTVLLCVAALVLTTIIGIFTSKRIIEPILRLSAAATALSIGEWEQTVPNDRDDEVGDLARAFNRMATQLREAFEELESRVEERTAELRISETREREKAERLEDTLRELQRTQAQLIQTEKMSSLGQLVAGVAHEINNPVSFIHGNLAHIKDYTQDLINLLQMYRAAYPNPATEIKAEIEAIDLQFLMEDLPKIQSSMQIGTERIREIVISLRNFSRLDESESKAVDIHEGLDNALLILQRQLKGTLERPTIQVIKEYGELPLVECYPAQLNQVIMHIYSNAIYELEQHSAEIINLGNSPHIRVCTNAIAGERVQIKIADNGLGMTEAVQNKIFDPFFTTKPVGKGTGLGLSISYEIVVEKHGGTLQCISTPGNGAEFIIEIPTRLQREKAV